LLVGEYENKKDASPYINKDELFGFKPVSKPTCLVVKIFDQNK